MSVQYPEVEVQLSGNDGNAFAIIGAVQKALRNEVGRQESDDFVTAAYACQSYDELLRLAMTTVSVS